MAADLILIDALPAYATLVKLVLYLVQGNVCLNNPFNTHYQIPSTQALNGMLHSNFALPY